MGQSRMTQVVFMRRLYLKDKYVSNIVALKKLKAKFPGSKATNTHINKWKSMLRSEGFDIPYMKAKRQ